MKEDENIFSDEFHLRMIHPGRKMNNYGQYLGSETYYC